MSAVTDERRTSQPVAWFIPPDENGVYQQVAYQHYGEPDLIPLYAAPPSQGEPVAVKGLTWLDATKGPGCPVRFQAWPLPGYRIFLYQWGETDQWACECGNGKGYMLPMRCDADEAKQAVEAEWRRMVDALSPAPSLAVSDEMVEAAAKTLWPSISPTWEEAFSSPSSSHDGYRVAHCLRRARAALIAALSAPLDPDDEHSARMERDFQLQTGSSHE